MAVKKEYRCPAHGLFESTKPICPSGCTVAERAFITPPGFKSARTRNLDSTVRQIAQDHGLTDMNNHGGTTAARIASPEEKRAIEFNAAIRKKYPSLWGSVPSGGVYKVGMGPTNENRGPGAVGATAALGAPPENAMEPVREFVQQPHAYVYKRDPGGAASIAQVKKAAA